MSDDGTGGSGHSSSPTGFMDDALRLERIQVRVYRLPLSCTALNSVYHLIRCNQLDVRHVAMYMPCNHVLPVLPPKLQVVHP